MEICAADMHDVTTVLHTEQKQDIICRKLVTSKDSRWALTTIYLYTSYMFAILMTVKSVENVIQTYLSGILSHKGGSIAILSNSGTQFKNKVLNEVCDQLCIKRLFSNLFHQ